MSVLCQIAIGVVAGFVGMFLGWLGRDKVFPFLRGLWRDLPDLNNTTWHRRTDEHDKIMTVLEIKQIGSSIKATVTRSGSKGTRKFVYRGQMSGHQIVLSWADTAAKEQLIGSMVLHLSQNLQALSGMSVYFQHSSGKVVAIERVYNRVLGAG